MSFWIVSFRGIITLCMYADTGEEAFAEAREMLKDTNAILDLDEEDAQECSDGKSHIIMGKPSGSRTLN
jgi:hypothetical protein